MKLSQKPSKVYIYLPLYIIFVGVVCMVVWRWMNPLNHTEELTSNQIAVRKAVVPPCFKEQCEIRSGIFQIWPEREIINALKGEDEECVETICEECSEIERFKDEKELLQSDACVSRMFRSARDYHFQQLSKLPKLMLFYDSGESNLTEWQRKDLQAFFKPYRGLMKEKGILILGRASKGGSDVDNQRLSYDRSTKIKRLLDDILLDTYESHHIYFGSKPPQLKVEDVEGFSIERSAYRSVRVTGSMKSDYSLRINQSVMVVVYDLDEDVFGLKDD